MLFDHLKPPIRDIHEWPTVHATLAGSISDTLNDVLPPGYYAGSQVRRRHETDAAVFEEQDDLAIQAAPDADAGGLATATLPPSGKSRRRPRGRSSTFGSSRP